ncbi:hypothetical protein [Microcoleus sp. B9-D4]|uniref:hypothetical protein n=1 Tax=Microcoleus sp. B9-D4 TaxID=2818711 RepID=UPI002FD06FF8
MTVDFHALWSFRSEVQLSFSVFKLHLWGGQDAQPILPTGVLSKITSKLNAGRLQILGDRQP